MRDHGLKCSAAMLEYDTKSFLEFFKLKIKRTGSGKIQISASFRIECTWVNGRWQAGPPQKLP